MLRGEPTAVNSPNIAGSILNQSSWWIFQTPLGSQMCVQQVGAFGDTYSAWRVKWSAGGFDYISSGSATVTPPPIIANDEVVLWGAGTDASPTTTTYIINGQSSQQMRLNVGVDTSLSNPRGWLTVTSNNTDSILVNFLWDSLLSLGTGDTNPEMAHFYGGFTAGLNFTTFSTEGNISTPGFYFAAKAGSFNSQKMFGALLYNNTGILLQNLGINSVSQKSDGLEVWLHRRATLPAPTLLKGRTSVIIGSGYSRPFGQIVTVDGVLNSHVAAGQFLLPINFSDAVYGLNSELIIR